MNPNPAKATWEKGEGLSTASTTHILDKPSFQTQNKNVKFRSSRTKLSKPQRAFFDDYDFLTHNCHN